MFDVGWPELLVILAVALLVFGPQRMVELARTAGKALREFRQITNEFSSTFTDILKEEPPSARSAAAPETLGQSTSARPLTVPPPAPVSLDEPDLADPTMPLFPEEVASPADRPSPAEPEG